MVVIPARTTPTLRRRQSSTTASWSWVARRVGTGLATLLVVSVLIFAVTQAFPGDLARLILGKTATADQLAAARVQLHLGDPIWLQYLGWLRGVVGGNLGRSFSTGEPVATMLGGPVLNSFTLVGITMVVVVPVSLAVGLWSGSHPGGRFDRVFLGISMLVNALPEFIIGTVLVVVLGTTILPILPPVSLIPPGDLPWWHPAELVLPVTTLAMLGATYLGRLVRASVIESLESEYVQMATLKGIAPGRILLRHVLPNSVGPTIQASSIVAALTLGGVVVTEYVYAYPGIGTVLTSAVQSHDVPVVQSTVLLIAATFFLLNLVADLVAAVVGVRRGR